MRFSSLFRAFNLNRVMPRNRTTKPLSEKAKIAAFIDNVSSKKYSTANKYLVGIVEDKIKKMINAQLNKPLF